jgi:hypothetical protein
MFPVAGEVAIRHGQYRAAIVTTSKSSEPATAGFALTLAGGIG